MKPNMEAFSVFVFFFMAVFHAWGTPRAQERNIDEINYALNLTHEKSQTHGAYKN